MGTKPQLTKSKTFPVPHSTNSIKKWAPGPFGPLKVDAPLSFYQTLPAGGRALGSMINKFRSLADMGHSTYTKLYESLVAPVTDYGSAIWGYKGYKVLDKVQNRASRFFTGVHKFAPIMGHVGDIGWISNRGRWKINMLRLWNRLVTMDDSRITKKLEKDF